MSIRTMPKVEAEFANLLAVTRTCAGLTLDYVGREMVKAGYETFRGTTVGQIEMGRRGVGLGEAIELARITGMDLVAFLGERGKGS